MYTFPMHTCIPSAEIEGLANVNEAVLQTLIYRMSITIQPSMAMIEDAEEFDMNKAPRVEAFVTDRLYPRTGGVHFLSNLWDAFRDSCIDELGQGIAVKFESYSVKPFGADLAAIIDKRKAASVTSQLWASVEKKQVKKAVNGELKSGKAWRNLEMKGAAELLPENRFAGPRSAV